MLPLHGEVFPSTVHVVVTDPLLELAEIEIATGAIG